MTQYGFYFDSARCTGCRTCEMACKDYKDLPQTIAFRRVYDYEGGTWTDAGDGTYTSDTYAYHVSLGCNHCAMPRSMSCSSVKSRFSIVCLRVCEIWVGEIEGR